MAKAGKAIEKKYIGDSLGLAKALPIHGKYLVNSWPAWSVLGMKSHSRNLGMNSHLFLLYKYLIGSWYTYL